MEGTMEQSSSLPRAFAVIERDRVRIWPYEINKSHPLVINNPHAIPHTNSLTGVRPTSNYDTHEFGLSPKSTYSLMVNIFSSGMNRKYLDRISNQLSKYDSLFLIGERRGFHDLISIFLSYATLSAPALPHKVRDIEVGKIWKMSQEDLEDLSQEMLKDATDFSDRQYYY